MAFLYKNFVWSTLAAEGLDTDTSFQLEDVSRMPGILPGQTLAMALHDGVQEQELVYATDFVGNVLTVQRGAEGTTPRVWPVGTKIFATFSAAMMVQLQNIPSADQITFTPAGTIAATSVQAAIEEVAADAAADDAAVTAAYIAADSVLEGSLQSQIDSLASVDVGLQNQINVLVSKDTALDAVDASLQSQITSLGSSTQPLDPFLTSIAGLVPAADQTIYTTGVDAAALTTLTSYARTLIAAADAAAARLTLALGALATLSTVATAQIDNDAVTLAKLANVTGPTVIGKDTAGAGDPIELTAAQLTTIPNAFTSALKGLAPASGGGTANYLRADGSWAAPPTGAVVLSSFNSYTTSQTWTKPANCEYVFVWVVGGGGASGGTNSSTAGQCSVGGGGGGGGTAMKRIPAASLGATESITIGAGGAGNLAATGDTGGTSSFGAHCSATGGTGGTASSANATAAPGGNGGSGGQGSGGDANLVGGYGLSGFRNAGATGMAGAGGSSFIGPGARVVPVAANDTGTAAGTGTGGGGGGPINIGSSGDRTGGAGGSGRVFVWVFTRE